ncbi:MAG: ATP-grasp domain-containing protein [Woeseia sp.]|nr:ATP-grasp domain-containing protein [Woeseia sp.]NNE59691.1 ATP-grasp domain-containing protein [Woeseia sp.]NNL54226.1 ATP-grasp domain-containing protein [Woeseia sp.]
MADFSRGLAQCGARVIGLGEHAAPSLPAAVRRSLSDYIRVPSLVDTDSVLAAVRAHAFSTSIERVECLWEPFMGLAAEMREMLDVRGMHKEQTELFRDKEKMKDALDAAGLRTPRHVTAKGTEAIRAAANTMGFPLVVKPIAGAGSAHTHEVRDEMSLAVAVADVGDYREVSVEEYIEGEEYTFDTVCANGRILYENIAWYRPKPIVGRNVEWISMQTVNLRNLERPELAAGRELGRRVIETLGFRTGFTHMEWFLTPSGEAVFGEIGGRPPGGRSVDLMNFSNDFDIYTGWAEAVTRGEFSQTAHRRYNAAAIFKRARGQGHIREIHGLEDLRRRFGEHIVVEDLLPIGAPRRNWRQTLLSDGYLIVRHPQLERTLEIADAVGTDLQIDAR